MHVLMHGFTLAVVMAGVPQTIATGASQTKPQAVIALPSPDPNAPPVIDIALRMIRAAVGGSSTARSAVRRDESSFLYSGLGPCVTGASASDPMRENSITWRASGRVRSVERGIAVADIEWQRLEHRPVGAVAGPLVHTTLTLPIGERVAVDFVDVSESACRMNGLIFEIGVAPDHGMRLSMSGEGRSEITGGIGRAGGGAGGVVGRTLAPAELEAEAQRRLQAAVAVRAAPVVNRPMPPRQYTADVWLVPETPGDPLRPLAQRLSQVIGGTGGRFDFPPIPSEAANGVVVVEISALVIPVGGDQLVVAITRHAKPGTGASPVSAGWIKAVSMPKAGDVPSFEIPVPDATEAAIVPRQGYGLRVRIGG